MTPCCAVCHVDNHGNSWYIAEWDSLKTIGGLATAKCLARHYVGAGNTHLTIGHSLNLYRLIGFEGFEGTLILETVFKHPLGDIHRYHRVDEGEAKALLRVWGITTEVLSIKVERAKK